MYKEKDSFRKLFNIISGIKKEEDTNNNHNCEYCGEKNSIQYMSHFYPHSLLQHHQKKYTLQSSKQ